MNKFLTTTVILIALSMIGLGQYSAYKAKPNPPIPNVDFTWTDKS